MNGEMGWQTGEIELPETTLINPAAASPEIMILPKIAWGVTIGIAIVVGWLGFVSGVLLVVLLKK